MQIEPRIKGENTEELKRKNILDKPVAAYSFGIVCGVCENIHEGKMLSGLYRQCTAPCPFTGCAVPRLLRESASLGDTAAKSRENESSRNEQEEAEPRPPLGCPYNPRTAKGGGRKEGTDFLSNTYARVQCFITRDEFLRYQTEVLGLHMGFFAFTGIRDESKFVYLARDPYKEIQITQMIYDPSCGWMPDRHEHLKSYLFQASRELGRPVAGEHDLLTRLRGTAASFGTPSDEARGWRGLTQFDRANQVLYVSDGEMSAFCLRWLLEEAENLWGTDGLRDKNGIDLKGLALISRERTRKELERDLDQGTKPKDPSWYPRRNPQAPSTFGPERDPHGWRVEDYLIDRILVGHDRDLKALKSKAETIRSQDTGAAPILEYMGFDDSVDGLALLVDLGIVVQVNHADYVLGTERFWRLVRYLQRYHLPKESELAKDAAFAQGLFRLIYLTAEAIKSGRSPKAKLTYLDCGFLLKWIAVAPNLEAHKAPITRDGCPGHIMLRRSFRSTQTKLGQVETCSRSWIAFPVFAYEPYHLRDKLNAESRQVGFFLGTIDDGECYENDGVLDAALLSEKLFKVKQWMTLIASVEAAGTYFEDIVAKTEMTEGINKGTSDERNKWTYLISKSETLGSVISSEEPNPSPAEVVARLEDLVDRARDTNLLPLKLSYLFTTQEMHLLTHANDGGGTIKSFKTELDCLNDVRANANKLASVLKDIKLDCDNSAAGHLLLDWKLTITPQNYPEVEVNFIRCLDEQLQEILSLKDNDYGQVCSKQGTTWRINRWDKPLCMLIALLGGFRNAVKPDPSDQAGEGDENDCIVPFKMIYQKNLEDLSKRIASKGIPPKEFELRLPPIDGSFLGTDFKSFTVKRIAYVYEQNNSKPSEEATKLILDLLQSDTATNIRELVDVVELYVGARSQSGALAIQPLEGNRNRSALRVVKQSLIERESQPGVYWIFVLSWLKK